MSLTRGQRFKKFFRNPFLNPFREIFEVKTYPFARTYRTDFKQKIKDTFWLIAGNGIAYPEEQIDKRENHLGLFDYATLGVSYVFAKLYRSVEEQMKADRRTGYQSWDLISDEVLVVITATIGFGLRYLAAAALTLVSLPFIGAVSLVTHKKRNALLEKATSLPYKETGSTEISTVGQVLEKSRSSFQKFGSKEPMEYLDVDFKSTHLRVHMVIKPVISHNNPNLSEHYRRHGAMVMGVNLNDPQYASDLERGGYSKEEAFAPASGAQAFLELNIGNVTEKLEKRGFFEGRNRYDLQYDTTLPLLAEEKAENRAAP